MAFNLFNNLYIYIYIYYFFIFLILAPIKKKKRNIQDKVLIYLSL